MKDIEDEIGLESSVNKTPYDSKIDFTDKKIQRLINIMIIIKEK